ncbi:hypothetical protein ABFT51_17855 [Paenibacillus peoriae]|uniref:hypothetical protein n=1 Tax=Paenibacillus peoriae TaxID=59893 RepID=UPI0032AF3F1D
MRDLTADLAVCEAATEGATMCIGDSDVFCEYIDDRLPDSLIGRFARTEDALFFAEAREGWPEAIRRAIEAEAEAASLLRDVTMEAGGPICENCGGHGSVPPFNEWGEGPDCSVCYGVGTLTRDVLYHKIDDLQTVIMDVYQKARNDVARWDGRQCVGLPVFQDRVYARMLVKDLQPILFPYQNK